MTNKRPLMITVLCIVMLLGSIVSGIFVFSNIAKNIAWWYPHLLAATTGIGLACMVGFWFMKKWSVVGYAIFAALVQVLLIMYGLWQVSSLMMPALVLAIGLWYYKLME